MSLTWNCIGYFIFHFLCLRQYSLSSGLYLCKKCLYLLFENFKHVYNVVWLCPPPFFYNPSLTPHQISLPTSGPFLKIIVTESNWCIGASHMCTYAEHRWPSRNHNSWSKLTLSERSSTAICSSARGGASWAPPPSLLEFLLAWSFPDPRLGARGVVGWWVWWPCHVQQSPQNIWFLQSFHPLLGNVP